MQRGDRCRVQRVGQEDRSEVVVAGPRPVKGTVQSIAAGDLLRSEMFLFGVASDVELRAGVGVRVGLVAEPTGPANECTDRRAITGDLNVSVENIGLVEGEGLTDLHRAIGVSEGKRSGSSELPCRGRHVKCLAQAAGQRSVVRVQRERITKLLCGLRVHEIERLAVGVFIFFEEPAGDLSATIGEGDAVELVLDRGGGLRRSLNRWDRRCHRSGSGDTRRSHRSGEHRVQLAAVRRKGNSWPRSETLSWGSFWRGSTADRRTR